MGAVLASAVAAMLSVQSATGGVAEFEAGLHRLLARPELDGASVGIVVRRLGDQETVFERQADQPLVPASNQKLLTLAMSLALLGGGPEQWSDGEPRFRFETRLVDGGGVRDGGVLEGDLHVIGGGDPTLQPRFFDSEDPAAPLRPFVDAVAQGGVRRIRGDLVVDGGVFDDEWVAPGWPARQNRRARGTERV